MNSNRKTKTESVIPKADKAEKAEKAEKIEKIYTNYDKEVMIKKISRLAKDEHQVIRRIIKANKPDIKTKKVKGGSFMYFHNLENKAYCEIDAYLDELSAKNTEELQKYISETDHSTEDADMDSITQARLRLSNREKHMLNRQRFDKIRTDEIQESIEMNNRNRNIDLVSSDTNNRPKIINIGSAEFTSIFDGFGKSSLSNTANTSSASNTQPTKKIKSDTDSATDTPKSKAKASTAKANTAKANTAKASTAKASTAKANTAKAGSVKTSIPDADAISTQHIKAKAKAKGKGKAKENGKTQIAGP